jgi:hypothetical protein
VRDENLYVTDRERGEILQLTTMGRALASPRVVASGLTAPEGIAATSDGFLVVDGATGQLLAVNAAGDTTLIATLDPGLPAPTDAQPPSMIFNGVVATGKGLAFVTGETSRSLYSVRVD